MIIFSLAWVLITLKLAFCINEEIEYPFVDTDKEYTIFCSIITILAILASSLIFGY